MTDFVILPEGTFAFRLSPWDSYLLQVEDGSGRRFTDGHTVDMLYTLHLADVPVERAIEAVGGLEHASAAVQRVLTQIEEGMMKHDEAPDPVRRFDPGPQARPAFRAGLIRRVSRRWGSGVAWWLLWTLSIAGLVIIAHYARS